MNLTSYVDDLSRQLFAAVEANGQDAMDLAERLIAAFSPALRLTLLTALSDAADEITRELAPGSVEVRLRAGEPEYVVTLPQPEEAEAPSANAVLPAHSDDDAGPTARINLRLPEQLKTAVEQAASRERLSVNAWLVRLVASALTHDHPERRPRQRGGRIGEAYTGWVR